ncbi:hypothetical protein [Streptomyces virginiae]|uniref:hypothetical protein n=1 Tax=Streptomyces virginiae TaxID=1961 RepID=UPI002DB5FE4C|nr:hypothetical protein [Streptomyces sp. CMAA1738]MEC4573642.1 hypothetical protein [Streptomyces sp. CMAA1738]
MAAFGYRLFGFQVYRGNKRTPVNLKDCNGEPFKEIAERLLKALSVGTAVGDPSEQGQAAIEESGNIGQPALRVQEVRVVDNTIRATAWAGRFGSHEKAIGDDAESDSDIKDKAASNLYRLVFAFPDDGDTGVLAVETIGRSCPVGPLTGWMRRKSREESTSGDIEGVWWRISVHPLADEDRLAEMIREGQAQKLVLVKHSVTAGRTRDIKDVEITASLAVGGRMDRTVEVVQTWYRRNRQDDGAGEPVSAAQGVRQLAAIVGPQVAGMDLDDGWVEIEDPDGQVKRVKPNQMAEVFTYRLSEHEPAVTPKFYAAARRTALALQPAAKVAIDWPTS